MPTKDNTRPGQITNLAPNRTSAGGTPPMPLWLLAGAHFAAFGLWFCWALAVVHLHHVGAGLTFIERFSLLAIGGLAAGCIGLALSFGEQASRQSVMLGWGLFTLLMAALGLTWMLGQVTVSLWQWQFLALFSGAAAGGCSALVHRARPRDRGLRSGERSNTTLLMAVGHWGIVVGFLVLPLLSLLPLSGQGAVSVLWSSHFFGRLAPGTELWLAWNGVFWGAIAAFLLVLWLIYRGRSGWRLLAKDVARSAWPFYRTFFFGLTLAAVAAWLVLPPAAGGSSLSPPKELVLVALIALALLPTLLIARHGGPSLALDRLRNADNWALALLWVMSQGSFLGLAAAFPLSVERLFMGSAALGYPGVFVYAWMLPLLGILVRPLGTWGAARWGGARTTQICVLAMVVASAGAAYWVAQAQGSAQPTRYFAGFMVAFALLFVAAGVAQSALAVAVEAVAWPRAWVWLSAMAAFGVFYISLALAESLERGQGVQALIGFALFYALCAAVNAWFYVRGSKPAWAL